MKTGEETVHVSHTAGKKWERRAPQHPCIQALFQRARPATYLLSVSARHDRRVLSSRRRWERATAPGLRTNCTASTTHPRAIAANTIAVHRQPPRVHLRLITTGNAEVETSEGGEVEWSTDTDHKLRCSTEGTKAPGNK